MSKKTIIKDLVYYKGRIADVEQLIQVEKNRFTLFKLKRVLKHLKARVNYLEFILGIGE